MSCSRLGGAGLVAMLMLGPSACSLNNVYLHDTQLNKTASAAANAFDDARPSELWQTMLNNLDASAQIEQKILAKSAEQRFDSILTNLENLRWIDLRRCARGACWSEYQAAGAAIPETTQAKFEFLQKKIGQLTKDIDRLEQVIQHPMPVQPASPQEISSTLSEAIFRAESEIEDRHRELEALKDDAINSVQAQLDELSAPWIELFPKDKQIGIKEKMNRAFEDVLAPLSEAEGLLELQTALGEGFIEELDGLLSDAGIYIDSDTGPSQEQFNEIATEFKDKIVELIKLDQLLAPLTTISAQVNAEFDALEEAVGKLQEKLTGTLDEASTPGKTARAVSDLFNKTDHPTLLKITTIEELFQGGLSKKIRDKADPLNIGAAFEDVKGMDVSTEFVSTLESDIGKSICNPKPCKVSDIIAYLKKDESRIEIIRKLMLAEFRASELAIYNEQLRSLKDELTIVKDLAAILNEQLVQQGILAIKVENEIVAQGISESLTVYHGLDCLARSAGTTHGEKCAADTKAARDHLTESLDILAAYHALKGHIRDQELQQWTALVRQQHRASIAVSKIAAQSREQLIAHGLQGLVAFTEGGITAEQIAGVLRLVNSSLLGIIAEGQ